MYPLIEPWMLAVLTGAMGAGVGFVMQHVRLRRRMEAVQRGAYVEQMRHAAELHRQADAHADALVAQAQQLTDAMTAEHEQDLNEQLAEQGQTLRAEYAEVLTGQRNEARQERDQLMHAHQLLRAQAQQALQNATDHVAALLACRPALSNDVPTLVVEALPVVARPAVDEDALRHEMAALRAELQETAVQRDQAGVRVAELMAELSALRQATALARQDADELEQARVEREEAWATAQRETDLLREQLDASLVELSAAARARDAREAQRAQLAVQLALAQDARERESRIAAEQRTRLQEQLQQLKNHGLSAAARLEAERDELAEQLTASRRTTRAAVLAAQQREKRLTAELAELRARVQVQVQTQSLSATQAQQLTSAEPPALAVVA